MALTYTPPGALGSDCPDFDLPSVDGGRLSRAQLKGAQAVVVMFICNHCPYVQAIEDRLLSLAREYAPKGVRFVAICSNDPSDYPEDAPDQLRKRWREKQYGFPYLIDAEQGVAKAFAAVCTPDLYVYDRGLKLSYRGRLDDSWRNPKNVQRRELQSALDALLAGHTPSREQNPSMGCSIKWKKGD